MKLDEKKLETAAMALAAVPQEVWDGMSPGMAPVEGPDIRTPYRQDAQTAITAYLTTPSDTGDSNNESAPASASVHASPELTGSVATRGAGSSDTGDSLVEEARRYADLLENGPYIGIKTCRETFRALADRITTLTREKNGLAALRDELCALRDAAEFVGPVLEWVRGLTRERDEARVWAEAAEARAERLEVVLRCALPLVESYAEELDDIGHTAATDVGGVANEIRAALTDTPNTGGSHTTTERKKR